MVACLPTSLSPAVRAPAGGGWLHAPGREWSALTHLSAAAPPGRRRPSSGEASRARPSRTLLVLGPPEPRVSVDSVRLPEKPPARGNLPLRVPASGARTARRPPTPTRTGRPTGPPLCSSPSRPSDPVGSSQLMLSSSDPNPNPVDLSIHPVQPSL